jgi:hypothetical protein
MKTANRYGLLFALLSLPLPAATPARAAAMGEVAATPGGIVLLFVLGVALGLVVVIGYVLRLLAGLGGPYLEELDGPQLDALQSLHASASLPTLFTHDHAKEQLV